ncbi:MAG: DNA-directed RNA polymerase subunit K [Candidatus Poseidoniia archaeon]|jgi:DNA-directed RNA polymerase subunit K|nr:DNA-directed RNA polymerase subunit K [Candidatus Poseidoniia archaeon]
MEKHSRFEKARIIGSRALQISMGAPVDIEVPEEIIDPVLIAQMEYDQQVIPITVVDRENK